MAEPTDTRQSVGEDVQAAADSAGPGARPPQPIGEAGAAADGGMHRGDDGVRPMEFHRRFRSGTARRRLIGSSSSGSSIQLSDRAAVSRLGVDSLSVSLLPLPSVSRGERRRTSKLTVACGGKERRRAKGAATGCDGGMRSPLIDSHELIVQPDAGRPRQPAIR